MSISTDDSPSILVARYRDWQELLVWMTSRVWPNRYLLVEDALSNFARVLQDFVTVLARHLEFHEDPKGVFRTVRYYKIPDWNTERYNALLKDYMDHCRLVSDLFFELTRAANYACDRVREHLFPAFRLAEGVLLVDRENVRGFNTIRMRSEYQGAERTPTPYPGLREFDKIRLTRDWHISPDE